MTSLRRVQPRFVDWRLSRIEEEQDRFSCSSADGASTAADCLSSGSVSDVDTCPPSPLPPPPPLDELEAVAFMPLPPPDDTDPPPPPPSTDGSYPSDYGGPLPTKIPPCEHIYSNVIDQETRELQEQRDALRFIKEKYDSLGKVKVDRPISSLQTPVSTAPENGRKAAALQVNEDQPPNVVNNVNAVVVGGGNSALTDCGRPQERNAIGETTTNFLVQCPANKSLLLASGGTVTLTARDAFLQGGQGGGETGEERRPQQLTATDATQQLHMQLHQLRVQQQQQAHRCCCCRHQQQAQQQDIHHHHHKPQQQQQQTQLENAAKSSSTTSSPPSPSASSSSSSTSSCSRANVQQHVHHHQHPAAGQPRSAAEQLVMSVPRCPLTDHELIQIDLFYRSHKTSVYVSPCVAALCFSTLSGSTGAASSSSASPAGKGSPATTKRSAVTAAPSTATTAAVVVWTFAKIGVPVIVEDTGDGRRRRRVYLVLAERGTGFELWRTPVDRAADYSVHAAAPVASVGGSTSSGSVAHHVIRLPPDYSVSARLEFEDPAGAEEFHRQLTSRFPPDVDDCSTSGRRKAKKIKDEQQKRKKALEKEREAALRQLKKSSSKRSSSFSKADISQPCCFSHVTRLERDGSSCAGGGPPGSRRVVQLQGGVDPVQMRLEPGSPAAAAAASMSPSGGSRHSRPYNSFKVTY